ncbi:unnamed protein product [Alopecurus aequalis]
MRRKRQSWITPFAHGTQNTIHFVAALVSAASTVLECATEHPSFLPPPPPVAARSSFVQKLVGLSFLRLTTTVAPSPSTATTRSCLISSVGRAARLISRWNLGLPDPDDAPLDASVDDASESEQEAEAEAASRATTTDGSDVESERRDRRSRRQSGHTPAGAAPCRRCRRHAPAALFDFLAITILS